MEAGTDGAFRGDVEAASDVVQHLRGGGGGERQSALGAAEPAVTGELQVVGAEVVPPLGDAVRLVDGEERDPHPGDRLPEALVAEAFRGDIEKAEGPLPDAAHQVADLPGVERRVEPGGGHATAGELVDLVLHQGDQGRDHQGEAGEEQGRDLVAERFAAAGGEDGGSGPTGQEVADHLRLARAEVGVTEGLGERRAGRLQGEAVAGFGAVPGALHRMVRVLPLVCGHVVPSFRV